MDIQDKGHYIECKYKKMLVFDIWMQAQGTNSEKVAFIVGELLERVPNKENMDISDFTAHIGYLVKRFNFFWKKYQRCQERVITYQSQWLDSTETMELEVINYVQAENTPQTPSSCSREKGRPKKDYNDCSKRSQRRRLRSLSSIDPSTVSAILDASNSEAAQVSVDEALSLILEAKLTQHQYQLVKNLVNSKCNNVFPDFKKITQAKQACYPKVVEVTETSAEVELQSLLDHTVSRIIEAQSEVISSVPYEELGDVILVGKWGFDGSSGHSEYKQRFSDPEVDDSCLFVTSYVPLRLVSVSTTSEETILWKNPRPASTRYCRPIRFQFKKESKSLSLDEEQYFKDKINKLKPSVCNFDGNEISINHSLYLTMIDGKICNALSDSSSASCYLCGATPKQMNDIQECMQKQVDSSKLEFGLSPLHSWIRFFEYFIHIAYRIDIQKWQVRTAEEKTLFSERKAYIQKCLWEKLSINVDKPRAGGSGNSNDGNTARIFFNNPEISAEVTGINVDLIKRCQTILQCLSSGYRIDSEKFHDYALLTAQMLTREYPWFYLPPSVHKVLIHGAEVISHHMLPIGELSEEAAESCNKLYKLFRRDFTRKMSREVTNIDLLNRLLLNSDPFITSLRKLPRKKMNTLSKDVISLLK